MFESFVSLEQLDCCIKTLVLLAENCGCRNVVLAKELVVIKMQFQG